MLRKILEKLRIVKPKPKEDELITYLIGQAKSKPKRPKLNKQVTVVTTGELPKGKKIAKTGLYANIHAKQERIKKEKSEGKSVETMRKPGTKGAPTAKAFKQAAKTAKGK